MRNKYRLSRFFLFSLAIIFSLSVFCAGCSSLKNKFTRKKKKDQIANEVIPILEPMEYPSASYSAAELYRHRYSLFQVWFKDLINSVEEKNSKKRILYNLDQVLLQINNMINYLKPEKQDGLKRIEAELSMVKSQVQSPVSPLVGGTLKLRIESIGKDIRQEYSPKKMEAFMDTAQYDSVD